MAGRLLICRTLGISQRHRTESLSNGCIEGLRPRHSSQGVSDRNQVVVGDLWNHDIELIKADKPWRQSVVSDLSRYSSKQDLMKTVDPLL